MNFEYFISIANTDLSDHKQILLTFDDCSNSTYNFVNREVEFVIEKTNDQIFRSQLIASIGTCEDSMGHLITLLNRIKHNSTTNLSITHKTNPHKPWINEGLLKLIDERNRYATLLKKSPSNVYLNLKRRELSKLISKRRKILLKESNSRRINNSIHNQKKMWKTLNEIIYNKKYNKQCISCISDKHNIERTEPASTANSLNDYFVNVGKLLYDQIPTSFMPIPLNNDHPIPNSMLLFNITVDETIAKIHELKNSYK